MNDTEYSVTCIRFVILNCISLHVELITNCMADALWCIVIISYQSKIIQYSSMTTNFFMILRYVYVLFKKYF